MKRLVDEVVDPRHARLAGHLRQIAAAPTAAPGPSPRVLAAIEAEVQQRRARWRPILMTAAAAALGAWLVAPRRTPLSQLSPPAPQLASQLPARVEAPSRVPAPAAPPVTPPRRPTPKLPLHLGSGRLMVRADERPATVEVPGGRVVVPPGGRARIEVHGYGVRIAAWRGDVTVRWNDTTLVIPAGDTRTLPAGDPLSDEAALLSRALRALRVEHDGPGARRLLDEHDRRFPDGALAHEAAQLRDEAGAAPR